MAGSDEGPALGRLTRRVARRSILVAWMILTATCLVMLGSAMETFRNEIVPGFRGQAETVGAELAAQIRRALELGVPMHSLVGTQVLFDAFLRTHPRLTYVELWTLEKTPLFVARRTDVGADPNAPSDVAIVIEVDYKPVGTLHVGIQSLHRREFRDGVLMFSVMLLAALLPFAGLALAGVVRRGAVEPGAAIQQVHDRLNRGEWSLPSIQAPVPEIRVVSDAISVAIRRIAEQRERAGWLSREVSAVNRDLADRVRRMVGSVPGPSPADIAPGSQAKAVRCVPVFLPFLAFLGDQLTAWRVPLSGVQETPGAFAGLPELGGLPLLAFILAFVGWRWLLAGSVRRSHPAIIFVGGCAVAVAAATLTWAARTETALLIARAAAGLGMALVVSASEAVAPRAPAGSGAPGWRGVPETAMPAAASTVAGASAGWLVLTYGGELQAFIATLGLLGVAGTLGLLLMRRGVAATVSPPAWVPMAILVGSGVVALLTPWLIPETADIVAAASGFVIVYGVLVAALIAILPVAGSRDMTAL